MQAGASIQVVELPENLKEITATFKLVDEDASGTISQDEFIKGFDKLFPWLADKYQTDEERLAFLNEMDDDQDGYLSIAEYIQIRRQSKGHQLGTKSLNFNREVAPSGLDAIIEKLYFLQSYKLLFPNGDDSSDNKEEVWMAIDKDEDGKITWKEYLEYRCSVDKEFARQKNVENFLEGSTAEQKIDSDYDSSDVSAPTEAVRRLKQRFDGVDFDRRGEISWDEACKNRSLLFPSQDGLTDGEFGRFLQKKVVKNKGDSVTWLDFVNHHAVAKPATYLPESFVKQLKQDLSADKRANEPEFLQSALAEKVRRYNRQAHSWEALGDGSRSQFASPSTPGYNARRVGNFGPGSGQSGSGRVQEMIARAHARIRDSRYISILKDRFDQADMDGDGFVSLSEFIFCRETLFPDSSDDRIWNASKDDLPRLFQEELDDDKDGFLSWLEYLNYFCKARADELMPPDWKQAHRDLPGEFLGDAIKTYNHANYNVFAFTSRKRLVPESPPLPSPSGSVGSSFWAASPTSQRRSPSSITTEMALKNIKANPAMRLLKEKFDKADRFGTGLIRKEDWQQACEKLFEHYVPFEALDNNKDEVVEWCEYLSYCMLQQGARHQFLDEHNIRQSYNMKAQRAGSRDVISYEEYLKIYVAKLVKLYYDCFGSLTTPSQEGLPASDPAFIETANWLTKLGSAFKLYIPAFAANKVTLADMIKGEMSKMDLATIGVHLQLHQKILLNELEKMKSSSRFSSPVARSLVWSPATSGANSSDEEAKSGVETPRKRGNLVTVELEFSCENLPNLGKKHYAPEVGVFRRLKRGSRLLAQTEWQLHKSAPNQHKFLPRIVLQYDKDKDLELVVGVYRVNTSSTKFVLKEDLIGEYPGPRKGMSLNNLIDNRSTRSLQLMNADNPKLNSKLEGYSATISIRARRLVDWSIMSLKQTRALKSYPDLSILQFREVTFIDLPSSNGKNDKDGNEDSGYSLKVFRNVSKGKEEITKSEPARFRAQVRGTLSFQDPACLEYFVEQDFYLTLALYKAGSLVGEYGLTLQDLTSYLKFEPGPLAY